MTSRALAATLLAALLGLSGCGGKGRVGDRISGSTLAIYSSAPLQGPSGVNAQAVVNGARLALTQVRDRIGKYRIVFESLDDSSAKRGGWDPVQTSANARLAAQARNAIGYLGEFDSGASAVSIPLLNRAGIPQISPASTAVGLTSAGPGASPGEPQKYYPTGVRTFARVIPNDSVEAVGQVRLQQGAGCRRTYVLDDGQFDGQATATSFTLAAQSDGLQVVGIQAFDPRAADYSSLAAGVAQTGPDCLFISAATESNAVLLTRQLAIALPKVKLFASAGVAETTYTEPAQGGIPTALDRRVRITVATLATSSYPGSARAFLRAYEQRFGQLEPYAIFGYEAMSLMLEAIARATDNGTDPAERSKVVTAIFATRDRHSVLGTYSIDQDGDTTLRRYGVYRVVGGALRFVKVIEG